MSECHKPTHRIFVFEVVTFIELLHVWNLFFLIASRRLGICDRRRYTITTIITGATQHTRAAMVGTRGVAD
jgi:hypothetical protein